MDHTHSVDLEAGALLAGSGARVIYLGELHIHSVTLMPPLLFVAGVLSARWNAPAECFIFFARDSAQ